MQSYLYAKVMVLVVGLFIVTGIQAAQTEEAKQEIDQLIQNLRGTSCKFQRNGTWYTGAEAAKHIQGKYDYLIRKGWADTAELFIERAGTESSFSGKPYMVQCESQVPQTSASWFASDLKKIRTK